VQPQAQLSDQAIPVGDHLGEVMPGIDVQQWERQRCRVHRTPRQVQQHRRILATGEQQHRPVELGDHLPDDVHRLRFQRRQVIYVDRSRCRPEC
jgi:hypothetical protein